MGHLPSSELGGKGTMWGGFDLEHFIYSVLGIIVYTPVYLIARALMKKRIPQKFSTRVIIMLIIGAITLFLRFFVLGFLGVYANVIWVISMIWGATALFDESN
jgi:hypothetical protein